jgi:hypothetical protein
MQIVLADLSNMVAAAASLDAARPIASEVPPHVWRKFR